LDKNKDSNNKRLLPLVAFALSAVVVLTGIVSIATSGSKASYKTEQVVTQTPAKVTVDANLADDLEILEDTVSRNASGKYNLETGDTTSNTFHLMPGVQVAKSPFVKVTGKTEIPAYLYIEVDDDTVWSEANQRFEYKIGDVVAYSYRIDPSNWIRISEYTDRKIFVYAHNNEPATVTNADNLSYINILKEKYIDVTADFDPDSFPACVEMNFFAYMAQAADSKSAYEIFRTQLAS